jgi:hypothetical protein
VILDRDDPGSGIEAHEVAAMPQGQGQEPPRPGAALIPTSFALDPETGQGKPYAAYAFAAQCALVEVDRASGMSRVKELAAAHDVGRAINRRSVIGQICGGVMMGLGMALMEEYKPGWTENLENYHLPTCPDAPRITPLIVEEPEETGPYGAKGVGEPALIPTAPGHRRRHVRCHGHSHAGAAPEPGTGHGGFGRVRACGGTFSFKKKNKVPPHPLQKKTMETACGGFPRVRKR